MSDPWKPPESGGWQPPASTGWQPPGGGSQPPPPPPPPWTPPGGVQGSATPAPWTSYPSPSPTPPPSGNKLLIIGGAVIAAVMIAAIGGFAIMRGGGDDDKKPTTTEGSNGTDDPGTPTTNALDVFTVGDCALVTDDGGDDPPEEADCSEANAEVSEVYDDSQTDCEEATWRFSYEKGDSERTVCLVDYPGESESETETETETETPETAPSGIEIVDDSDPTDDSLYIGNCMKVDGDSYSEASCDSSEGDFYVRDYVESADDCAEETIATIAMTDEDLAERQLTTAVWCIAPRLDR